MTGALATVPLVVFEAADSLMAIPASEIRQFVQPAGVNPRDEARVCDLGEYFGAARAGKR